MTVIDWLFAGTAVLCLAWLVTAVAIIVGDRRDRRAWEQADARAEWRAFVDAMRRLEQQDRDQEGSA